jgi:hypothetical protein
MDAEPEGREQITVAQDVVTYMDERGGDFRISTSCSGPVLMPVRVKPAKPDDIPVRAGNHIIYISRYQIQWISEITMRMVPRIMYTENPYDL